MTIGMSNTGGIAQEGKYKLFEIQDATRGAGLLGAQTKDGVTSFAAQGDAEAAIAEIRKREIGQGAPADSDYAVVKNKETGRFEVHRVDGDLKALASTDGAKVSPGASDKHEFIEVAIFDDGNDKPQTIYAPGKSAAQPTAKKDPPVPQPTANPVKLKLDTPDNMIERVRKRPNANVEGRQIYTVDQLRTPATRDAFLKRCPQAPQGCSTHEANRLCGVTATVTGIFAGNPQAIVDLAKALQKNPNHWLAKGMDSQLLTRLASGQLCSDDVQALALALHRTMIRQPGARPAEGNNAGNLMALVGGIKELGVNVPNLKLTRSSDILDPNAVGHWTVVATDAKPPVAINTWADTNGQAEVFSGPDAEKKLYDRNAAFGSSYRTTEAVTVRNGGDQCDLGIYAVQFKPKGPIEEHTDAHYGAGPIITATYKRDKANSHHFVQQSCTYNDVGKGSIKAKDMKEKVEPPAKTVGFDL